MDPKESNLFRIVSKILLGISLEIISGKIPYGVLLQFQPQFSLQVLMLLLTEFLPRLMKFMFRFSGSFSNISSQEFTRICSQSSIWIFSEILPELLRVISGISTRVHSKISAGVFLRVCARELPGILTEVLGKLLPENLTQFSQSSFGDFPLL